MPQRRSDLAVYQSTNKVVTAAHVPNNNASKYFGNDKATARTIVGRLTHQSGGPNGLTAPFGITVHNTMSTRIVENHTSDQTCKAILGNDTSAHLRSCGR